MVRWLTAVSFLALAACGQSVTETATQSGGGWSIAFDGDLNGFFDCLEAAGATLVAAHRGGPGPGFPENAVETMAATLAAAPALMEIDVATSADGVLFLNHDDTLDRTTTGKGAANSLPWSEIRKLKLIDPEGRVTRYSPSSFPDALAWAEGRTILEVDIKTSTRYEDVAAEIIRQHAEDRVVLLAYKTTAAAKLHALLPRTMISLNLDTQSALNGAVAMGVPEDRLLGYTGKEDPKPRLFSILNGRGVEVIFATLGGPASIDNDIARSGYEALYAEIAADGVDIIATDRPKEANAALAAAGRAPQSGACGVKNGNI